MNAFEIINAYEVAKVTAERHSLEIRACTAMDKFVIEGFPDGGNYQFENIREAYDFLSGYDVAMNSISEK